MNKSFWLIVLYILIFITSIGLGFYLSQREKFSVSKSFSKITEYKHFSNLTPKLQFQSQTPSLAQIFSDNHHWTATLSAEKIRTLIATGDVIPARSVNYQTVVKKNFLWPFEKTADILKNAEITFINLETPLIANCPLTNEGMIFCGEVRNIEGLKFAGIDVVSLANNHAGNWGTDGINQTIDILNRADILVTGITSSNTVFKNIRGLNFAFLGYDDIGPRVEKISWLEEEEIQQEINQVKQKTDIVIVTFHWGVEYTSQPTQRQKDLAHLAIDSGADLIIGNHPHWIQPIEIYKEKLIVYAHGNFVFDQMWSQKTREGVVGRYTFYNNKLLDVEFLPIQIENFGQPYFVTGEQKVSILEEMKKESINLYNPNTKLD